MLSYMEFNGKYFKEEGPEELSAVVDSAIRLRWLDLMDKELANNALDAVVAVRVIEQFVEQRKRLVVEDARKAGKTWQEIGDALGITRQAAQKRYGYLG